MKTTRLFLIAAMTSLFFAACNNDDTPDTPDIPEPGEAALKIEGEITGKRTFDSDTIYILGNRVTVVDGAELTIEAGTIIKGEAGTGANASALLIAQGGKLFANGTASNPIVMTSIADEIVQGQISSPNLAPEVNGLWGGLIILGKAPISADAVPAQIEGIPPSDSNGQYGGDIADDNSGSISYVSIRHGGTNIGEGNEINGLTLGGVGSGTKIEYVEIVANQDDGIEFFGGTVTVKYALVWNQGDDAYDIDQAFAGTVDNFIYIGGSDSDHGMEIDGPEGSATGSFTMKNGSMKGYHSEDFETGGEFADNRDGATGVVENVYWFNFFSKSDIELDDDASAANWKSETLDFVGNQFNLSHLSNVEGAHITIDAIFADNTTAGDAFTVRESDGTIVTTPTVGATKSAFTGWTWADAEGQLVSF